MFGSAFGGSAGCVFGTVFALAALAVVSVLLCTGILGGGCFAAKKAIDHIDDQIETEKKEKSRKAEETAVGAGYWNVIGDIRVGVTGGKVAKPIVVNQRGEESEWSEELLQIGLRIQNASKTKKIDYSSPSSALFGERNVKLVDEHGNVYHYHAFEDSIRLKHGARPKALYPGDEISDRLCFDIPVSAAKTLRLSIRSSQNPREWHEFRLPNPLDKNPAPKGTATELQD